MSQDHTPDSQDTIADPDTLHDAVGDDEFESIGDHHRMAAHHFQPLPSTIWRLRWPMTKATMRPIHAMHTWLFATSSMPCSTPKLR